MSIGKLFQPLKFWTQPLIDPALWEWELRFWKTIWLRREEIWNYHWMLNLSSYFSAVRLSPQMTSLVFFSSEGDDIPHHYATSTNTCFALTEMIWQDLHNSKLLLTLEMLFPHKCASIWHVFHQCKFDYQKARKKKYWTNSLTFLNIMCEVVKTTFLNRIASISFLYLALVAFIGRY